MKSTPQTLPKVGECITYIESLGYKLIFRRAGAYMFSVIDRSRRPEHNWEMKWSLGEMRDAIRNGC